MNKFLLIIFCVVLTTATYSQTDSTITPASFNNSETDTLNNSNSTLPVFSTTSSDVSGGNAQAGGFNSLLGASRDIFVQSTIMHFMTARYLYRGYNTNNRTLMMNGVRLNSLQTGVANFSVFGGMNDVIRLTNQKTGLGSSRYTFGDIGGYSNLNVFASSFRKGLRVVYSQGNRIFKERFTLTYSSGMTQKGWAFALSGSARYASQGYVPGTAFQGFGFFAGADKKFSEKNTLSLVGFWSPITQARQSYETDEAFALMNDPNYKSNLNNTLFNGNAGNNHYNSFWGFQNGQERSSKISKTSVPTFILTDLWKINDRSTLTASIYGSKGRTSLTYLNYITGVPNPQPDYYKYMPSYYGPTSSDADPVQFAALTHAWQTGGINPATGLLAGQVDWDGMYRINSNNLYTVHNVDGQPGTSYTGKQSAYILEERRQDVTNTGYNAIYNVNLKNDIHVTAGSNGSISNTRYYKVVNDLLGGDYWLDYNQFASSNTPNPNALQNNIKDPNKIIRQGDVFGYDYNINVMRFEEWGQIEKATKSFDIYASATISNTSFYRFGNMVNGLFPAISGVNGAGPEGSSGGRSKTLDFVNYGVKAGVTYKIDAHNFITVNGASMTKPPLPNTAFVSQRSRNDEIPGAGNQQVLSGDISYNVRLPWLKGRLTYYRTQLNNQTVLRSYFDDDYKTNVNYFMTNVNQVNQGLELGLEGYVTKRITIVGALGYGQYLYTNRPTATISADNTATLLAADRTVYLKNYHVGGTPEVAGSIGVRYSSKKYWYAGIYLNYFANNYVTLNPDRRTAEALSKYIYNFSTNVGDPQVHKIIDQEKLPDAYTVDFMAGKSFRFKGKYGLSVNLMINNLTNNMFKNYGMEQLRHDDNTIDKFPNKYAYTMGLTYQMSVAFMFN
ncbi:MAG TPA: hypothetical protein VK835_02950 [Bacteroidia bacterium]|nr:hypothetical protein [Bacteroidia bacterium]